MEVPRGYETWTADTKHAWLWDVLMSRTAHQATDLPPLRLPFKTQPLRELGVVVRKHELDKALTRTSDLMEPGRPKVIHARGAVAMIEFEPSSTSPFTGLLSPPPHGGATGLIRMSLVAKVLATTAYTPAIGIKLLIDGKPSADLLAMNHTIGQGRDFDLFSNTMTNDLSATHTELRTPQKVMSVLFDRVSSQPRRLALTHFGDQLRDGSAEPRPVVPDGLVFRPTPEAQRVFRGRAGVDFRLVLADVEPGTPLYDVESDRASGSVAVGVVRMTTRFVSSEGGDRLFFRHVQHPGDRKL